jgi:hypothetical protein
VMENILSLGGSQRIGGSDCLLKTQVSAKTTKSTYRD